MTNRGKLITILAVLAFVALLLYNTLSAQRVSCEVCVDFGGGSNCATASHSSEKDATQAAQTTACGVLAHGMDQSIACGRVQPTSVRCHPL
ncbi:MAG TPA: hypothetical protein VLT17_05275 [Gemmatimonadales bacterium]|jgi:hypothetical protein|nr:hypothetical protein [Gemmatimonadales bacterium]